MRQPFPHGCTLDILVEDHFSALRFVPLVYMSVFMPLPYCSDFYSLVICLGGRGIRKCDISSFVLAQTHFGWCFEVFCGCIWLLGFFFSFYFCEKCHLDFDRNCIDSVVHTSSSSVCISQGQFFLTGTTLSALIQKCILACILCFISVVSKNDCHVWLFVPPTIRDWSDLAARSNPKFIAFGNYILSVFL